LTVGVSPELIGAIKEKIFKQPKGKRGTISPRTLKQLELKKKVGNRCGEPRDKLLGTATCKMNLNELSKPASKVEDLSDSKI